MPEWIKDLKEPVLITVIVNHGLGSKVLKVARQNGATGGTIYFGHGTVPNKILQFFGWDQTDKEIVFIAASFEKSEAVILALDKVFQFEKANHGILFTKHIDIVRSLVFSYHTKAFEDVAKIKRRTNMYHEITIIVPRGQGDLVVEAARLAGAKGATLINGRGAGTRDTEKILGEDIEPEKEIVMLLVKNEIVDPIIESVQERLGISEHGHGIIYAQPVSKVHGIPE